MVKSRLSRDIGAETALSLYKNFCLDLLETLRRGRHAFKVFFYPPESGKRIAEWLGQDCSYAPQRGGDLGERMKNAFHLAFAEGFSRVLLIGSDIPDLPNSILREAFGFNGSDAVIGPAFDGGYYLIGFKEDSFLPEVFDGIPWGTDEVFKRTMERFRKGGCKVRILPTWRDVDRFEDLRALAERNRDTEFADSRTMAFISGHRGRLYKD